MDIEILAFEIFKDEYIKGRKDLKDKIKKQFKDMTDKQLSDITLKIYNYQVEKYGEVLHYQGRILHTSNEWKKLHLKAKLRKQRRKKRYNG